MEAKSAKGVFDILPHFEHEDEKWKQVHLWQHVEKMARATAEDFGFREIRTPLFERTELFERGVGAGTDIVAKEMYTFEDRGGRSLTLRPEGTAPAMRAFVENHLEQGGGVHKYYYLFSMFRYERQQAGRYRQHHQFGVEAIGSPSYLQDAEVIDLLYTFFHKLGLKNVKLQLNSIGSLEARQIYRQALKDFLTPYVSELSEESRKRLDVNPLRILDSKNPHDQRLVEQAPSIIDFLSAEDAEHFHKVQQTLQTLGIEYHLNPRLVRGLDYYNKTVFEITTEDLGAQNSIGGGGRYDGLLAELGGPNLPAFGFGTGLERIILTLLAQKAPLPPPPRPLLYIIPVDAASTHFAFQLLSTLRKKSLAVEMELSGKKVKQAMRLADALQARYVLVIGDEELKSNSFELKEMETKQTHKVSLEDLEKGKFIW